MTLVTLGAIALARAGEPTPLLGPGKPAAMLAYLACSPGRTASREHLIDLLWADAEPDRARHALRQAIWQLRQLLGESSFAGKDELTLAIPLATDRDHFLALIEKGELEAAVAAYTGPFLPAFASAGGARFEHWADTERDRLQTTFVRAVERLVRRQLAAGSPRAALLSARRLLEVGQEPLMGRRLIIEAHLALGDAISAAAEADALTRWATGEEWVLDAPTRAVIDRTRVGLAQGESNAAPATGPQLVAELVGRESQFATILDAWADVRAGKSRHVHVVAPAGLGKTRLLRELESRLRNTGGTVRYVRAHPGDREMPFALTCEIARALTSLPGARGVAPEVAATLLGLDPSLANVYRGTADTATGDEAKRRRAFALTELLRATSEEGPFALLVDDLHWADTESFVLLESMLARTDGTKALLVSATRPMADQQLRSEDRTTIQLAPLSVGQIGELLDSIAVRGQDEAMSEWPARLFDATGGNPLLTIELIQLAQERDVVAIVDGAWRCGDETALRGLLVAGEGIRQRLRRLGPESRELLLLLALSGAPLHRDLLVTAMATEAQPLGQRLQALERQGMVQPLGERWEPAHDEIAAAAVDLFAKDTPTLRARLARALELHGGDLAGLTRTAGHYVTLQDTEALARLALHRMSLVRRRGAPEQPAVAARRLLGAHASEELHSAVVRALPLSVRMRTRMPLALTAAGVLLLAGIATTQQLAVTPPDATFEVAWYGPSGMLETGIVDVRRQNWDPNTPLDVVPVERPLLRHLVDPNPTVPIRYTHTGDSAVTVLRRPGTSNEDIALLTHDSLVWLTHDERDDLAPRFLPDGSGIVFLTSRWSPQGGDDTDVATLDFASRIVTRLTSGQDWDGSPAVSPDGTRLAFIRRYRDESNSDLCVMPWNGGTPACHRLRPTSEAELLDWVDASSVLVRTDSLGVAVGVAVDIRSWATATTIPTLPAAVVADPKSLLLACLCEEAVDKRLGLQIGPATDPRARRPVRIPGDRDPRRIALVGSGAPSLVLHRLKIQSVEEVSVGSQYRLTTEGYNRLGGRVAFDTSTVRWTVRDTTIARVDSLTGILVALRTGRTSVHSSAAGWRKDSITVRIGPSTAKQLLREEWDAGWGGRWRTFGEPRAVVARHAAFGTAMHNSGDGRHVSGVYSTARLPRTGDFTVEALVSSPIDSIRWQRLLIHLGSVADSARLGAWDHGAGEVPGNGLVQPRTCFVAYPAREGTGQDRTLTLILGSRPHLAPAPAVMRSGRPYRLRLTLFADGHCGLSVDGDPIVISLNAIRPDSLMRIWLTGNSVATDIAIGKVTAWQGDPGGVDWGRLRR